MYLKYEFFYINQRIEIAGQWWHPPLIPALELRAIAFVSWGAGIKDVHHQHPDSVLEGETHFGEESSTYVVWFFQISPGLTF